MVALHHALEKENSGSARLSDFYNNKNNYNDNNKNDIAKEDGIRVRDDDDDNAEIPQDVKGDHNSFLHLHSGLFIGLYVSVFLHFYCQFCANKYGRIWLLVVSDSPYLAMYSDDDPTVMMDYDFKDLNSINRATGETVSWIIKA